MKNESLSIAYAIQNVGGIDLRQETGDTVPVKYTLKGLEDSGHKVSLFRLNGREVTVVDDMSNLTSARQTALNVTGTRPFLFFESVVRRLQRELRLSYYALFDSYRFYEACKNVFHRYDLCHEHNGLFSVGAALACQRTGTPYILTFSADPLMELRLVGKPLRGIHAWAAKRAARFTYRKANKIICVSKPAKEHLIDVWRVVPEKIEVMPNGVDVARFNPDYDSRAIRSEYNLGDKMVVMFVGGFYQWHGIDLLVDSFARVLSAMPNAHLMLVGDGPVRAATEQQIADLNLVDAVTITGLIPHARIPEILSVADVVTAQYPKLPQELWFSPLKLYEYMAAGKAIVAAKSGQIADVITHEQNGMLVEPGDLDDLAQAIIDLLASPKKRERLGRTARDLVVDKHSWDHYISRIEELYCRVLQN